MYLDFNINVNFDIYPDQSLWPPRAKHVEITELYKWFKCTSHR